MKFAVIPARGGSKRIKKKNIKHFLGHPIISFTIKSLIQSKIFDKIYVSTDDDEISKICMNYNVEIIQRPDSLANDIVSTNEVVRNVIEQCKDHIDLNDYVCCVYPTAPFLRISDLLKGLKIVSNKKNSQKKIYYSFPVVEYNYPIQRALKLDKNDKICTFWDNDFPSYSNDLKKSFHDVGQFYWGISKAFTDRVDMFSGNSIGIQIPGYLSHDIDNEDDWKKAELYYEFLKNKNLI